MARFARFDSSAPSPAPVLGWYDTEAAIYAILPAQADMLALTDDQWLGRGLGYWAVTNKQMLPFVPPVSAPLPWLVSKLIIVDRLGAMGKLRAARTALKLGVADSLLSDAELLVRDRWDSAVAIGSDDSDMRTVLGTIGVNADAILAVP